MYDPLIEIRHKSGSVTYVRASEIKVVKNWGSELGLISSNINLTNITNLNEVVKLINEIELRNEATKLYTE